jgi:hypothetical protein
VEKKRSHVEVAKPEMSVRHLADFMAASERGRRTIVEGCKYRSLARLMQHKEAILAISSSLKGGPPDLAALKAKADFIRNKLASDDFDALTNETNADYVLRFSHTAGALTLPNAERSPGKKHQFVINGVNVRLTTDLMFQRLTRTNKVLRGGLMLRYAKGRALKPETALFQSAAIHGLLCQLDDVQGAEVDKSLCITLDVYSGIAHPAPGASVSMFKNIEAACASIAERWPNIKPPKDAVL